MKTIGKILFFNANDGNGIIMTAKKEKINFNVADWDDFDTMPSLGLEVRFMYEDAQASSIVSLSYVETNLGSLNEAETQVDEVHSDEVEEVTDEEIAEPQEETLIDEPTADEVKASEPQVMESNNEDAQDDSEKEEHFKADDDIDEIGTNEEIQEELGEREESVTVTMNLPKAVSNYFDIINENIQKRERYKKVEGRLDYLVIRRFIWTTFNNLSEVDLHIITPKIKTLSDDLKAMAKVHDDFVNKTKYPALAYEEVFLSCQAEYKKIRDGAEKTIQRINQLKGSEKHLGGALKIKKEELSKQINTDEFDVLGGELKSLNGTYVDVVHMMAELDDRYKHDMKLLIEFEKEYKEDFYELFAKSSIVYKKDIVDILSAQAYTLDAQLWNQAKSSKAVKAHFHKAGVSGELNTKTYLKYYLDTQDVTKASSDNKILFKLYEYFVSIEREHVMVILSDVNDALEFESCINKIDKTFQAKAFIDEKSALKWAMKNSVKVLIIEDRLSRMQVETFLKYYKKYILVIPKLIFLGNSKKFDEYAISKILSRGISGQIVAKTVKELISAKSK